jgi:hypothetical protein
MLVALPGAYPAVLRDERLDPYGTRQCRPHTEDGISRMPSAADEADKV